MSLAALELDLDVFSGPFDLLLTLVLREEVDLLELQLADVVLAYLDHLEAPRRARPRDGNRVHRADRRAARAEVAPDAGRRRGGGARHRARAGRRGAARADARRPSLPRRRRAPARAARRASTACASARRRCPRRCAARSCSRPRARRTRRCSARRSGACCRCRPRSTCATSAVPRVASPSVSRTCAGCCAAAPSTSTRRCAAPTA